MTHAYDYKEPEISAPNRFQDFHNPPPFEAEAPFKPNESVKGMQMSDEEYAQMLQNQLNQEEFDDFPPELPEHHNLL